MGFCADEPRALPWAGMNDALGVSALLYPALLAGGEDLTLRFSAFLCTAICEDLRSPRKFSWPPCNLCNSFNPFNFLVAAWPRCVSALGPIWSWLRLCRAASLRLARFGLGCGLAALRLGVKPGSRIRNPPSEVAGRLHGPSVVRVFLSLTPNFSWVNHAPAAVQPLQRFPLTFAPNENCCPHGRRGRGRLLPSPSSCSLRPHFPFQLLSLLPPFGFSFLLRAGLFDRCGLTSNA